jgi:hypothetical protein
MKTSAVVEEKDRAQEVLDIVGGNIDTAERVIVKLRVK